MHRDIRILVEVAWIAVAIAIVLGGWFGYHLLGANKTIVEAKAIERAVPVVRTSFPQVVEQGIPLTGTGFITAAQSLDIAAEAGGRIVELHPAIENRSSFAKGDILFRLDDRQAQANVAQIRANIESTNAQKGLVQTQLDRAKDLRSREIIAQDRLDELVTQMQEMEASLRSLKANLQSAEVSLSNTTVVAPFDGRVLLKKSNLGAVLAQGTPVAEIYSANQLEVEIAIGEKDAVLIDDLFGDPSGRAFVESSFAGQTIRWSASIDRAERQIDAQTRTIDLVLRLDDPEAGMTGTSKDASKIPALINSFVEATIFAQSNSSVFAVDANAVRAGDLLWTVEDDTLRVLPVRSLYRSGGTAYVISDALAEDTAIVNSALALATDGMSVKVETETAQLKASGTDSEVN